jgi:hypothetical protein
VGDTEEKEAGGARERGLVRAGREREARRSGDEHGIDERVDRHGPFGLDPAMEDKAVSTT